MFQFTEERVHFLVKQRGEDLALVQARNGAFCITRNGRHVAGCRWSARQMVTAIRQFRTIAATTRHSLQDQP